MCTHDNLLDYEFSSLNANVTCKPCSCRSVYHVNRCEIQSKSTHTIIYIYRCDLPATERDLLFQTSLLFSKDKIVFHVKEEIFIYSLKIEIKYYLAIHLFPN